MKDAFEKLITRSIVSGDAPIDGRLGDNLDAICEPLLTVSDTDVGVPKPPKRFIRLHSRKGFLQRKGLLQSFQSVFCEKYWS